MYLITGNYSMYTCYVYSYILHLRTIFTSHKYDALNLVTHDIVSNIQVNVSLNFHKNDFIPQGNTGPEGPKGEMGEQGELVSPIHSLYKCNDVTVCSPIYICKRQYENYMTLYIFGIDVFVFTEKHTVKKDWHGNIVTTRSTKICVCT